MRNYKHYKITYSEQYGRELTASNPINAGEQITVCELLVLNKADTKLVDQTDLKYYVFKYNDTQDCIVLGDGEIFNHSDTPNVGYKLIDLDNRKVMLFYALKDIKPGEQLFTDYNSDVKVDTSSYKVNML